MRREADDEVSGEIELRFTWDITAKGLLTLKKRALQHVISQRSEILSLLYPADNKAIADAIAAAELNLARGPDRMQKDGHDSDDFSVHSGATDESRFEDLLNEAKKGSLTVRALAARGLGRGKSNPLAMQFQVCLQLGRGTRERFPSHERRQKGDLLPCWVHGQGRGHGA